MENQTAGNFHTLYKISAIIAILITLLIPVQLIIYGLNPPPTDVHGFLVLFQKNWLLGLLSLDLLYIINNTLLVIMYAGLYVSLRNNNPGLMLIALISGCMGVTAYYSSTVAFEMLSLSEQYAISETAESKMQILVTGKVFLEIYKGTAFDVYYILNAITLLLISSVMLRSRTFSKATAIWGFVSGTLMLVPTTAGTMGMFFGISSLLPWSVFSVLVACQFLRLRAN